MFEAVQWRSYSSVASPTCTDTSTLLRREVDRLAALARQHSLDAMEWQAVADTARELVTQVRAELKVGSASHLAPLQLDRLEAHVGELAANLRSCAVFTAGEQERDAA